MEEARIEVEEEYQDRLESATKRFETAESGLEKKRKEISDLEALLATMVPRSVLDEALVREGEIKAEVGCLSMLNPTLTLICKPDLNRRWRPSKKRQRRRRRWPWLGARKTKEGETLSHQVEVEEPNPNPNLNREASRID